MNKKISLLFLSRTSKNKKIAIITVNFNSEFLLPDFIKDVQKQDYKNWYMLIVNCSENNSQLEEILNAAEDRGIML